MLRYVKTKKILSIKVNDEDEDEDDEHVHDSKALPELVDNIIESGSITVAMGKLLGDDGVYEGNDVFRYLSER